jgi:four helix bundle protein
MERKRQQSILHSKSYSFAIRIIKMMEYLHSEKNEFVISKQILRSGTAIGALVRESEFAQSNADFANKLSIALKEANETDYWLSLLHDTNYINDNSFSSMMYDCNELVALLVASIKTAKKNI